MLDISGVTNNSEVMELEDFRQELQVIEARHSIASVNLNTAG